MTSRYTACFSELTEADSAKVGLKCANLGELHRAGFTVPQGYALKIEAFDTFLMTSGTQEKINELVREFKDAPLSSITSYKAVSLEIRKTIESSNLPEDVIHEVTLRYVDLCNISERDMVEVAVRSAGVRSRPGQYETLLNIRGIEAISRSILRTWSSAYNARSLFARTRENLPLEYAPIGIAVMRMVHPRSAGIMFTACPVSGDRSKIIIEANWGLGECVASGSVTPDRWTVEKSTFTIIDKAISSKKLKVVSDNERGGVRVEHILREMQDIPSLCDSDAISLAKIGAEIEKHFRRPQDIEWALDETEDRFNILQSRPVAIRPTIRIVGF